MKIVVVGGGSAGWMSASTMLALNKGYEVTVIESPNVPTMGVGESTINGFVDWVNYLGIDPVDFLAATDGSIKLSIHFQDFYQKGDEGFFYPFGSYFADQAFYEIWNHRREYSPETLRPFADSFFPNMALVRENKFIRDVNGNFRHGHYALHFDAIKFAGWLRDNYCGPRGVKHVRSEVRYVNTSDKGVESLVLSDGTEVTADLYIDCSGYKSILLGGALGVPYKSYRDTLPNNRAWATQMPYIDRQKELVSYTDCTAVDNGWIWNIPLYSRVGTGYVYSDEFVTDDEALAEFKAYLARSGRDPEQLTYRKLEVRTGVHERIWEKNVVAIGMAAGFIEPLESSGLFTVHEFLGYLAQVLNRGVWNAYDIESFNYSSRAIFDQFAKFVAMHYAFSARRDTKYWRKVAETKYIAADPSPYTYFTEFPKNRFQKYRTEGLWPGINCVSAGMKMYYLDSIAIRRHTYLQGADGCQLFSRDFRALDDKYAEWEEEARNAIGLSEWLEKNIR
jgi:flavin-dependent dehydrogenase